MNDWRSDFSLKEREALRSFRIRTQDGPTVNALQCPEIILLYSQGRPFLNCFPWCNMTIEELEAAMKRAVRDYLDAHC